MDISALEHFKGTLVPVAPDRKRINVLIGQSLKQLLTVFEKRKGASPKEPNYVLTRPGSIAGGGQVSAVISGSLSALRVQVDSYEDAARECAVLKREVSAFKETVREYERQEEVLQPSLNDELAKKFVEPQIKVPNGRYRMQVPFKSNVLLKRPKAHAVFAP